MPMFHLDWLCCADGYRIEKRRKSRSGNQTVLTHESGGSYIVRNSVKLYETTPMGCEGLYKQLAACRTADDALAFVGRHGFLDTARGTDQPLVLFLGAAKTMRKWERAIDAQDWPTIAAALNDAGRDSLFGGVGRMSVRFDWREGMSRPELRLAPNTLLSAIYVQALHHASGGYPLRKCLNPTCWEWFSYGSGTKHRETAKYCSPKCKGAHTYAKMKEHGR